ncbi:MAG: hypothetical protein SOX80_04405 [Candidatus Fimivivens sp.]|nr:hypothetical protein [Candidatus Fimivivens sp.]MDY4191160.1 hypothetical protein [Oscillospiraceae bacterium]
MTKFQKSSKKKIGWKAVPLPARCVGCPYPKVGITCHSSDGTCTRTDMEQLDWKNFREKESC